MITIFKIIIFFLILRLVLKLLSPFILKYFLRRVEKKMNNNFRSFQRGNISKKKDPTTKFGIDSGFVGKMLKGLTEGYEFSGHDDIITPIIETLIKKGSGKTKSTPKEELNNVKGGSIMLEEFARTQIASEEMHEAELKKMLLDNF